jgi:hypothetical protein
MLHAAEPLKTWITDTAGPFNFRGGTKIYLHLFMDIASRYLVCAVVPNKSSAEYAKALRRKIFYAFGIPNRIHSDLSTTFISDLTQELSRHLKINLTYGLAFHPRGQGAIEVQVREMKKSIETCVKDHIRRNLSIDFEEVVEIACAVHNQTPHRATNISPHQFLYGTDPINPSQVLGHDLTSPVESRTIEDIRTTFREIHTSLHQSFLLNEMDRYNSASRRSRVEVGFDVYRTINQGLPNQETTGPHKVLNKAGYNSWAISALQGNTPIIVPDIQLTPIIPADNLREGLPPQNPPSGSIPPRTDIPPEFPPPA